MERFYKKPPKARRHSLPSALTNSTKTKREYRHQFYHLLGDCFHESQSTFDIPHRFYIIDVHLHVPTPRDITLIFNTNNKSRLVSTCVG